MKAKTVLSLIPVIALTGCETIQTPRQRQEADARQQLAQKHQQEQVFHVRGQVESIEMENARLVQEVQNLRQEVRNSNAQISQLNSKMNALEAKQQREMAELISRVEGLLNKAVASRPAPSSGANRGPGREHIVEAGHTLSAIASAYGTSVSKIKSANNLKSDSIYVGQKLFIPD